MANLTDHQVMNVAEVTYGTPVAVSRSVPVLGGQSTHDWDPTAYQGQGLWVGAPGGIERADRGGAGIGQGKLTLMYEALSKGHGVMLNAATGTATSTLVSGSTFQEVFTPTVALTFLPAQTVQVAPVDNLGTIRPHTYAGCTVTDWELDLPPGPDSIATWKFNLDAKSLSTATGAGSFAGASGASAFGSWSTTDTVTLGGAITAPGATTLATSSGSITAALLSMTLTSDNKPNVSRWGVGTRAQPTVGERDHKIKFKYEYNDNTVRDALINQTSLALLIDLQTAEALSTGNARLQLAIPVIRVTSTQMPIVTANGETVVGDIEGQIRWDGALSPFYLVMRTADAAL